MFSKPCLVSLISEDTHLVFSMSPQASGCQQAFSKPCLVNMISKETNLVFCISRQASGYQQVFSKPCLVNLISKDTHLVFSISQLKRNSMCAYRSMHACQVQNDNTCSETCLKGDISRFFIFLCNFLLCVGFYVFIKKSVHFPQFSVIKWV